jgi:hypothetical protein
LESIFLILSGAILAAGVLYWFWSHIQLTQKKVQLLENAVFELRGMLQNRAEGPAPLPSSPASGSASASGSEPVYQDLPDDDDWDAPAPVSASASPAPPVRDVVASTPLEALDAGSSDDLQPGGGAGQGVTMKDIESNEQFRELFSQAPSSPAAKVATPVVSDMALEAMPVRELRRLAEQRGITGVSDMKKKELVSALRQQITTVPTAMAASPPSIKEVVVERTLDLTEPETVELADVPVLE